MLAIGKRSRAASARVHDVASRLHRGLEDVRIRRPRLWGSERLAHRATFVERLVSVPTNHVPPKFRETTFTCPHCTALAYQEWGSVRFDSDERPDELMWTVTRCLACARLALWDGTGKELLSVKGTPVGAGQSAVLPRQIWAMVYPADTRFGPEPNEDLPDDIRTDYVEARDIADRSPRGAAALLRLCLQKLCVHLGQPGRDINTDIAALVEAERISASIQTAMDTVRITGNEGVHPGTLRLEDDPDLVAALFLFVNLVAEEALTRPRVIDEMYARMPEGRRNSIEQRDRPRPSD
jgi:Domain of unknown function (DUF4145)